MGVTKTVTAPATTPTYTRTVADPGRSPRTVPSAFTTVTIVVSDETQLRTAPVSTLPAVSFTCAMSRSVSSVITVAESGVTRTLAGSGGGDGYGAGGTNGASHPSRAMTVSSANGRMGRSTRKLIPAAVAFRRWRGAEMPP